MTKIVICFEMIIYGKLYNHVFIPNLYNCTQVDNMQITILNYFRYILLIDANDKYVSLSQFKKYVEIRNIICISKYW